jgi:hypothetical protein
MDHIRAHLEENARLSKVWPSPALAKLLHLQQIADDRFAATRELSSKRGELLERAAFVRADTARLSEQNFIVQPEDVDRKFQNPADISGKELALLDAQLEKINAAYLERVTAAQEAGALVENLRDYAQSLRGMASPFKGTVDKLPKGEALRDGLDRLRKRGAGLDADLRNAEAAGVPSAEAKAAAREQLAQWRPLGAPHVFDLLQHRGGRITWPDLARRLDTAPSSTPSAAVAILTHVIPDLLIAAIDQQIDELCDDSTALDHASRSKLLKAIREEKLAVERQEEALVERLERDGMPVARRANADPRAVLGLSADSPSVDAMGTAA